MQTGMSVQGFHREWGVYTSAPGELDCPKEILVVNTAMDLNTAKSGKEIHIKINPKSPWSLLPQVN